MLKNNINIKDFFWKGTTFKVLENIDEKELIKTIELFKKDSLNQNLKFGVCVFLGEFENKLIYFDENYNLSKLHLFLGVYGNLCVNMVISTEPDKNFDPCLNNNLLGENKPLYMSKNVYIYDLRLKQYFFDFNHLYLNKKLIFYKNFFVIGKNMRKLFFNN